MDANGTRYQLRLGPDDWSSAVSSAQPSGSLAWDATRSEVTLQPRLYHFAVASGKVAAPLDGRRSAGRDRFGNWYWIGPNRDEILTIAADTGTVSRFWPVPGGDGCPPSSGAAFGPLDPDPAPSSPSLAGLAVTAEHELVVGSSGTGDLLVFDLHGGGPPSRLAWPAGVSIEPFDMAAGASGGVWLLDRHNSRAWALDRRFAVRSDGEGSTLLAAGSIDPFQPLDGSEPRQSPPVTFPSGVPLQGGDPIAIEALPDGSALVLINPPGSLFAEVARYGPGGPLGPPQSTSVLLGVIEPSAAPTFQLVGYDFAFVPATSATGIDRVVVVASDGEQSYSFGVRLDGDGRIVLDPVAEYLPMRRFGGKGLVTAPARFGGTGPDAAARPFYDFGIGWVPLVPQRRPRYVAASTVLPGVLDGHSPGCVWHRLTLDATIPPETSVRVSSRAGDDKAALATAAWRPEPTPYRRGDGTELPYAPPADTGAAGAGTWELLFQQARGRYLELKLDLTGNGRATPRLRALRAYYPRFSYLTHYLPAVYREDDPSASFLDRFLANVEGFFTAMEDRIVGVEALFDVRGAPAADLDWLASWFGVAFDPNWDEARRRLFLSHAMDFFQYRGTVRGLVMGLRLVFDECPDESIFTDDPASGDPITPYRIVELFASRTLSAVALGDPTGPSAPSPGGRWQVTQGRAALNAMYAAALGAAADPAGFPLVPPALASAQASWQAFAAEAFGFVPTAGAADRVRWQAFLERRYQSPAAYNRAYGLTGTAAVTSFSAIDPPQVLPADGAPLIDWFQFNATVLGRLRAAHRFRVMLPAPASDDAAGSEHQRRFDLAAQVLDLEKPAHTVYDVRFYWAYFQVGSARLGYDTLLDRGGRSPQLMTPMILGRGPLASSYLAPALPGERARRWFLGERGLAP